MLTETIKMVCSINTLVLIANHANSKGMDGAMHKLLLQEFDVGIMPLPDRDFERGKCGLKLIQYMSCYLPVVASPVGVNRELINHGKNGFIASTQNEWFNALECLYVNTELRKTMGFAGRAIVEESFSLVTHADRVFSILQEVGNPD